MLLTEAKIIVDVRHEPSDRKFFGTTKEEYIHPRDGFYFIYNKGQLVIHSTSNEIYDAVVKYGEVPGKAGWGVKVNYPSDDIRKAVDSSWNQFGGIVNLKDKTITISKESANDRYRQRNSTDIKNESQAFRELKRFGVDDSFKIKGLATHAKTVGEFIKQESAIDKWVRNRNITFYHGTSLARAQEILKNGLRPGKGFDSYVDLIPGYSEYNVYLATTPKSAEFYGKRQAKKEHENEYAILEIKGIDQDRLVSDDSLAAAYVDGGTRLVIHRDKVKPSLGRGAEGQVGYNGIILPSKIKLLKKGRA